MDLFKELPLQKRRYLELLFRNCTEEVKYYMTLIDIEADRTFIKAGTDCTRTAANKRKNATCKIKFNPC